MSRETETGSAKSKVPLLRVLRPIAISIAVTIFSGSLVLAQSFNAQPFRVAGLTITLSGLPDTSSADVTVRFPDGFRQTYHLTGTSRQPVENLAPGIYTISTSDVDGFVTPEDQMVELSAGQILPIVIAYTQKQPVTGVLSISLSGLPGTSSVDVTVRFPDGFRQTYHLPGTGTETVNNLAPGTYTISTSDVDGFMTPEDKVIELSEGQTQSVAIVYKRKQPVTGALTVVLNGPADVSSVGVTVAGANGFNQSFSLSSTRRRTLQRLTPGIYTVTGAGIPGYSAASREVRVNPGQTSKVTISYSPLMGALSITLTGLPSASVGHPEGLSATVTVSGPHQYGQTLVLTGGRGATLRGLAPGTYTVAGADAAGYTASGSPTVTVVAGQTSPVTITYEPIPSPPPWHLPAIWIVLLVGIAIIGARAARRKQGTQTLPAIHVRAHRDLGRQTIYIGAQRAGSGSSQLTGLAVSLRPVSDRGHQEVEHPEKLLRVKEAVDHV